MLAAYFIAVSMMALLWAGAYGGSFSEASRDVHGCVVLKDNSARLACYDNVAQTASTLPGRGYAPR